MLGLMQDWPLVETAILDHAARNHGSREVVSRLVEGPIHRTNYAEIHSRARKFAKALRKLGIARSDRVGTLGWNTHRHLESWYAILGLGAIYHTLNPRLFPEQIAYIADHAEDKAIVFDACFLPILEAIQEKLPSVKHYIALTDRAHIPASKIKNILSYEELVAAEDDDFAWVVVDEREGSGLCYTSGTTGNPKGVLYSHRSNTLHALAINTADGFGVKSVDNVLCVVPLFHANSWALAFAAPMQGAKLVLPGPKLDGAAIYELLETEKITLTCGVPTVWLMLLQYLETEKKRFSTLKRVAIGGSACPPAMIETFEKQYGVEVCHAWGMTEMSPLGTLGTLKAGMASLPHDERLKIKCKQGRAFFTVEMKIVDDDGNELPRDGKSFGHLIVKGPAISSGYFKGDGGDVLARYKGWFDTGDVATLDTEGYMQITDRAKDVIKSGGEWISSIDIENFAVGHPAVAEAAVIGVAHPKWDERPLLVLVKKNGAQLSKHDMLSYLEGKIAKWWMPDDVVFIEEIPHTATGKIQKLTLRAMFKDYVLPSARAAE